MSEEKCDGCFMQCDPVVKWSHGQQQVYPCVEPLRKWAIAHKDDPGDERGFVWERKYDKR